MTEQTHTTWFEISNQGWKRMNAGRSLGHLVREAISNVFDAEGATRCDVTIQEGSVIVEDDAPGGIRDTSLITTVFLTDKEDSYLKRGRKGRGLKELISAGQRATVDTAGYRVIFNEDGTRSTVATNRKSGTQVVVTNYEWTGHAIEEAIEYISRFFPPQHIKLTVNGHTTTQTKIRETIQAHLETTTVADGKQVDRYRDTTIMLRNLRKGETEGWVYEMGIPVQSVKTKFHIDVQQRIPMNDNRDVVNSNYLPHLFGAILDGMALGSAKPKISKAALKDRWVLDGINHAKSETQRAYAKVFVPSGAVIRSVDKNANDRCKQQGLDLVDISHLPWAVRDVLNTYVYDAKEKAEDLERSTPVKMKGELRDKYIATVNTVEWICKKLTGESYTVTFMSKPRSYTGFLTEADHNKTNRTIRFNVESEVLDFQRPLSPEMISTVTHELAHRVSSEHDEKFIVGLEQFCGKMALLMLSEREELERLAGGKAGIAKVAGKTVPVHCQWHDDDGTKCTEIRMVKPQDVFQVKFCHVHQKENQKRRARVRRLQRGW